MTKYTRDQSKNNKNDNNKSIKSPGSLVLTFYASVPNIYNKITPNIKKNNSILLYIDLSEKYTSLIISLEKFKEINGSKISKGCTVIYRENPVYIDPRNDKLGAKIISKLENIHLTIKKLNLKITDKKKYYTKSFELGIPQVDLGKFKEKIFGIENNLDELNGIDFKKGCYVGQENTARIKLKNKLSKRLLPVEIINGKLDEDETVYCNQIEIGKILINEEYPFALVKFSNENFNKDLTLKSKNGSFKIFIPEWLKI